MRELYLYYTLKHFVPDVWYSSGTGEKYRSSELPVRIDGYVRFEWECVIVFIPESAASSMVETGDYDASFFISRLTLTLRSVSRPVQFASHYAMLQHMHALIVDQKYTVASVGHDNLFLRASPKRRSSWTRCWVPSGKVADACNYYHPPELRKTVSGKAVLSQVVIKRLPS